MTNEPRIVLSGVGPKLSGLTWESSRTMRIGRQADLDIVLRDASVKRVHAEVKHHGTRWVVRDLACNPMFPTRVNDATVSGAEHVLARSDVLHLGRLKLKVCDLVVAVAPDPADESTLLCAPPANAQQRIATSGMQMRIRAQTQQSWDKAFEVVTHDRPEGRDPALLTLVRANHHLSHISNLEELLRSILADTVGALRAQRGSIILAEPASRELSLKATFAPRVNPQAAVRAFSRTLVRRCFDAGESLLCDDVNADESLAVARSIRHGAMSSVICALLRTPRGKLGILHLDRGVVDDPFDEKDLYSADAIAASVAVGIETAQVVEQQREQFIQTVTTLARAVEVRDQYTGEHTRLVTEFSLLLADELKLSSNEKYQLQIGTPLHDIGKIGIDDAILRKPGKLTPGEFEAMKTHTTKGASLLDAMMHLGPMIPIVRHHHERWDGSGYPDGLAHDAIPLIARIVSIADAFDAMTSDRPYRPAMPADRAFLELVGRAGSQFDPNCVYAFLRLRERIEARIKQK